VAQQPNPMKKSSAKAGDRLRRRGFRRVVTVLGLFAAGCED
jgi:hypothetical protein